MENNLPIWIEDMKNITRQIMVTGKNSQFSTANHHSNKEQRLKQFFHFAFMFCGARDWT